MHGAQRVDRTRGRVRLERDAVRLMLERRSQRLAVAVCGEHQHANLDLLAPQLLEHLVAVRGAKLEIEHDDVGTMQAHELGHALALRRRRHDLDVALGVHHRAEPLEDERMVVYQHHTNHRITESVTESVITAVPRSLDGKADFDARAVFT